VGREYPVKLDSSPALIYRAHRAVIFAIAQLSCYYLSHFKNGD